MVGTVLLLLVIAVLVAVPAAYLNVALLFALKPVLDRLRHWLHASADRPMPRTGRA